MPQFKEISGDLDFEFFFPGVAAGTALEVPMLVLPFNATIQSVKWVPSAAITANVTNYATLSFRNRTGAGAGTAVPASRAYSATNSAAQTSEQMTLSNTASDLLGALGDVLTLAVAHSGTGLIIPAGLVQAKLRVR
jgi:hypothetical protein